MHLGEEFKSVPCERYVAGLKLKLIREILDCIRLTRGGVRAVVQEGVRQIQAALVDGRR
jgi:hypothetical protein